jgi:ABC-type transport system involved in multi-copper enzyme maturation permease subunit
MQKLFANPVMIRELRGRMRGRRAMIMMTVYLTITSLVTLLIYLAVISSQMGMRDIETGRTIGKAIFLTVMTTTLVQVCLIIPTLTAGSIAGEKERQTYDLLLITTLSPLQIVLGKMMAQLAFAMLMIIAVLPLAGLAFVFGGVSGIELLVALIGLSVTALLYSAEGLYWSTMMKTTQGATSMAIGTVIMMLLVIPFLFVIISIIFDTNFRNMNESAFYIYTIGTMLCLHPFIALGMTAASLSAGESLWIVSITSTNGEVLAPSPWLGYTLLALLLTLLLLFLSVRRVKPDEYIPRRKRSD